VKSVTLHGKVLPLEPKEIKLQKCLHGHYHPQERNLKIRGWRNSQLPPWAVGTFDKIRIFLSFQEHETSSFLGSSSLDLSVETVFHMEALAAPSICKCAVCMWTSDSYIFTSHPFQISS
jgi:hypothetical protein